MDNKNIFQIYIQDEDDRPLPTPIANCISTVASNGKPLNHFLLGNSSLREIIKNQLGNEALNAYESLIPYAYKADFGRYCLLYIFGGWYFDCTVKLGDPLPNNFDSDLIVFKDAPNPGMPSWDVSNSVIFSKKGHKALEVTIEAIIRNVKSEYYGISPLSPTGPSLWGKSIANTCDDRSTLIGSLLPLTPYHSKKNYAFLLPDGTILAYGKSTWGTANGNGLSAFDTSGTNNYNELYYSKNIYRKIF